MELVMCDVSSRGWVELDVPIAFEVVCRELWGSCAIAVQAQ